HSVKPACQRFRLADRGSPSQEQQEGGLEGVLGIREVVEVALADAQHHRAMTADNLLEGRLPSGVDELAEQLSVGSPGLFWIRDERANLTEEDVERRVVHRLF